MNQFFKYTNEQGIEEQVEVNFENLFGRKEGFILDEDFSNIFVIDKRYAKREVITDSIIPFELDSLSEEDKHRLESEMHNYILEYSRLKEFKRIPIDNHVLIFSDKLLRKLQYNIKDNSMTLMADGCEIIVVEDSEDMLELQEIILNEREVAKEIEMESLEKNNILLKEEIKIKEEYRDLDKEKFKKKIEETKELVMLEAKTKFKKEKKEIEKEAEKLKEKLRKAEFKAEEDSSTISDYENEIESLEEKSESLQKEMDTLQTTIEELEAKSCGGSKILILILMLVALGGLGVLGNEIAQHLGYAPFF